MTNESNESGNEQTDNVSRLTVRKNSSRSRKTVGKRRRLMRICFIASLSVIICILGKLYINITFIIDLQ